MPFEITIRYGEAAAASGRIEPGETRLELVLPRLPAREVEGRLEVRASEEAPATAASASCISEWLRCGEAVLSGETLAAPLTFSTGAILGSLDRPHESTLYLTFGARLLRVVLRIPTLLPVGETPPAAAWEEPAAPPPSALTPESYGLLPPAQPPQPAQPPPTSPVAAPPPVPPPPATTAAPAPPPPAAAPAYAAAPTPAYQPNLPPAAPSYPGGWGTPMGGAVCRNHPDLPTSRFCGGCRNPFCDHCLVEFRGAHLCAWCKQAALVQMQRGASTVDPRAVVMWARIYDFVVSAGAFVMLAWQAVTASQTMSSPFFQMMGWWYALSLVAPAATLAMALPPAIGLGAGRRWAYAWQTFMLIPSMLLSCLWAGCFGLLLWVPAIVLLVYWVKPEVRDYCEQSA